MVPPPALEEVQRAIEPVRAAVATDPGEVPQRVRARDEQDIIEPIGTKPEPAERPAIEGGRDVGLLLVALGLIAGLLCMALELAAPTKLVFVARLVLLVVGLSAVAGRALTAPSDPARPHWSVVAAPPFLGLLVAAWALATEGPEATRRAIFLAGCILMVVALNLLVVGHVARPVQAFRDWVASRIAGGARRVKGEVTQVSPKELVADVSPGDHVVVEAGETVPCDLEIVEGEVSLVPWLGAGSRVRRKPGDLVVATARVEKGQLRGRCTRAGDDRAFVRCVLANPHRIDVQARQARFARRLAERGAVAAALLVGGAVAFWDRTPLQVAMVVVAVYASLANVAVGWIASLAVARGVSQAFLRGVAYRDAAAWDRCGRVTAAVFCARGTLVRGEPELATVEVFDGRAGAVRHADDILAVAAGALAGERDPIALSLRRAARSRAVPVEPVRNIRVFPGQGVSAVIATGEALSVGTRALMLERRISVASAEQRIYELEGAGRTVVLVAIGGRLAGLLALQDGLRSGARAAVQHLLDVRVEPILMSADARETCEALGRALDIDHLRPEVSVEEQEDAVGRVADTGATVAVLGHTPHDDAALGAAAASVVLGAAGTDRDDFSATLASDDVRDAALAIALAQRTWSQTVTILVLLLVPVLFGVLVVTAGLLPPEYAPLAQLVGAVAAAWQLVQSDRRAA
ncbi:MAG: HAD family hydrolase [Polyangiaceae bacterium]